MMRAHLRRFTLLLALALGVLPGCSPADDARPQSTDTLAAQATISHVALPAEAHRVIERILNGASFTHPKDGSTFHNRERLLPQQPTGYYREYTVPTPQARNRGARRLVTGGTPPTVFFYTNDHYRTFTRVEVTPP